MRRITAAGGTSKARIGKLFAALCWAGAALLLIAPSALAEKAHGRGLWGTTTDEVVVYFALIMIAGFPLLILAFSLIQWRLDKRKEAHKAAEKASLAEAYWRGGW